MGQGSYMGLVWGMTEKHPAYAELMKPTPDECDCIYGEYGRARGGLRIHAGQANKSKWIGFHVAMGGGVGDGDTDLEYTAMPLSDVDKGLKKQLTAARAEWKKFAAWAKKKGLDVGPGELVLVADYD